MSDAVPQSVEPTRTEIEAEIAAANEILRWGAEQDFREWTRRAIRFLRVKPKGPKSFTRPLWAVVMDAFCVGSTVASRLCVLFGFDPDEQVRPPR